MGPSGVPLAGFPIETLKRLSTRPPTSIGVVTHGTSSHWAGEVPSLGVSKCEASTGVPSMGLALESLITFKQWTTFYRCEMQCYKIPYSVLRGSDLNHILEAQRPMLIMKCKLTPCIEISTCWFCPNEERNHTAFKQMLLSPMASKIRAHPGMPKM